MDYDDEDQEDYEVDDIHDQPGAHAQPAGHGFGGIFNSFNGFPNGHNFGLHNHMYGGDGMGYGGHPSIRPPARAFSKSYHAYSTAILEIKQGRGERTGGRSNVMHGGKSMKKIFTPSLQFTKNRPVK